MEASHHTELILVALLAAVMLLMLLGQAVKVPYPILLVVGGLGLGVIPGAPRIQLPPELVLVILLPPLLYSAAFFSSLRDLRASLRPISLLSIGLVLATMCAVAAAAHAWMGFSWPAAFVLGAIVAPTDPIAATSIARRVGIPRRIVTIIEGESLINDATALVAYRFAVVATVTGAFSLPDAALRFLVNVAAGVAIGLAGGYVIAAIRRRLDNPPVEITISLFTPYFAYLPADAAGVSGVLAAVTVGIYMGWRSPQLIKPSTRIQAFAVWEILVFLVNAAAFILIGLQLPSVLDGLAGQGTAELIGYGALTAAVVMGTRLLWVFPFTYGSRLLFRRNRDPDTTEPWQHTLLVGWTGMRGAVSLAAALALPFTVADGGLFPSRDLIVFLAFAVILATLLLQGLSLPLLIRALGIEEDHIARHEESKARLRAARAALDRLEELAAADWVREDTVERVRRGYEYRQRRFAARFDDADDGAYEQRSVAYQRLVREVLEAQRAEIITLRNRGLINDEVMHRIERDLDLEDSRLEIEECPAARAAPQRRRPSITSASRRPSAVSRYSTCGGRVPITRRSRTPASSSSVSRWTSVRGGTPPTAALTSLKRTAPLWQA
jgi:monovalent cation/hydrogen antiporter